MTSTTPHSRSSAILRLARDAEAISHPQSIPALRLQYALRYLLDTLSDLPRDYLSVDFRQAERDAHDLLAIVEGRS